MCNNRQECKVVGRKSGYIAIQKHILVYLLKKIVLDENYSISMCLTNKFICHNHPQNDTLENFFLELLPKLHSTKLLQNLLPKY